MDNKNIKGSSLTNLREVLLPITLATAVSERVKLSRKCKEPFLLQEGFIMRTQRKLQMAYRHLGKITRFKGFCFN
jgi:Holliday junction resolvasome RuvABC ATP-dependent DNA helicase subunit